MIQVTPTLKALLNTTNTIASIYHKFKPRQNNMRLFKEFPEQSKCKLCGTNNNEECVLISIDDTDESELCEATPVHINCIKTAEIRYSKKLKCFYMKGK